MSSMVKNGGRRTRRSFTEEFKAGAVRLVLDEGKTVGEVARDLDLTESALRNWVEQARADRTQGQDGRLTTAEREELARLRKENRAAADGARHPKKSGGLLREGERVRFAFVDAEKAEFPVATLCQCSAGLAQRLLRVARAARVGARPARIGSCACWCEASFEREQKRYGSPRIHEDLVEDRRARQPKRVMRLMQEDGLKARARKRFKLHDDERSRSAGRGEPARTASSPRTRRISGGSATRPSSVIGASGEALPRGDPRPVLAVRRGLGGQRGQRPAPHASRRSRWRSSDAVPERACCITPTRAARTRARTTRPSSSAAASPAA